MKFQFLYLIPILFFSTTLYSSDNMIKWMRFQFPPFSIIKNDTLNINGGVADSVLISIKENLSEYKHKDIEANFKRAFTELEAGNNVVHNLALKTEERAKYCYFSDPYIVVLPNSLIIKSDKLKQFSNYLDSDGKVDLDLLIKDKKLVCGLSAGRAYGGSIDKAIALLKDINSSKVYIDHKKVLADLLKLIKYERVDYTFGYPSEINYYSDLSEDIFLSLPVKGMPDYNLGHYAFPKTGWGKQLLDRVNPLLLKLRKDPRIKNEIYRWLDSKAKKRLKKFKQF